MTTRSSADAQICLWGGYDIRPYLIRMGWQVSYTTEENHKLGDDYVHFGDVGIYLGALDLAGFFDDGARAIAMAFDALATVKRPVLLGFSGNVLGRVCMGGAGATKGEHRIESQRGQFCKANGQAQSVGLIDPWLWLLIPLQTITADHVGSNWDAPGETTSALGGVLHAHVTDLDLDGGTGLKVTVLQGNGSTMTAIPSLNYTFTTEGAVRVAVATGTVGTHVRAEADFEGTPGGDETATLAVAWARG